MQDGGNQYEVFDVVGIYARFGLSIAEAGRLRKRGGMSIYGKIKKIKGWNKALDAVRKEAEKPVSIAIIGNPQVEVEITALLQVDAAKKAVFGASEHKREADREARLRGADLAIAVVEKGESKSRLKAVAEQARMSQARLVVVNGSDYDEAFVAELKEVFRIAVGGMLFVSAVDAETIETAIIPPVVKKLAKKEVSLAVKLPAFRDEVVKSIIADTARQNALIGVAVFVPGADMPLMMLNQVRMVMKMAAAYDEELSVKRLNEILAVIGGGLALRIAARQLLGFVPVAGWAIKGGIAYGGTYAMGEAAKKYFDSKPA
ncbi:MAG: hypothetical protein Q8J63_06020 [Candidatus Aquicultor sp.]|nr:hypothetical protein [Candidatus Aquicultor sp.]